jgi:hypothetical protein
MLRAILFAFTYAGFTFSMAVMFWLISDHSLEAILKWGALYMVAFVAPVLWSIRLSRLLKAHGLELSGMNLYLVWSPITVAFTILGIALPLLWETSQR